MEPEGRWYHSQRLKLRYWAWGDESKPPLLLIHGTRDHARSWDPTAEALLDRYSIYAPDLRGHGDSDWAVGGEYSIIDYALDLHALGEHIGREPYTIIGHSLGGGITLQYAGAFPEKVERLVTIEGLGPVMWYEQRPAHVRMRQWILNMRDLEKREPRGYASLEEATRRMMEANRHLTPEMARHLTIHGAKQLPDGTYQWKFDNFTRSGSPYQFNMEDARDLWNQVRAPHLILWGEESWGGRVYKDDILNAFHNYEAYGIADAGHWVHHDQFEEFIGKVNAFLPH